MPDDDRLISEEDEALYLGVLQAIYDRVEAARAHSGPTDLLEIEFGALQLRKVLELIVMGSLVTNRVAIEETATALAKKDVDQARKLARRANPDYWPKASTPHKRQDGVIELRDRDGALTEANWGRRYGFVSDLLHAQNPLAAEPIDIGAARRTLGEIAAEVIALTNHYSVHLADRTA